MTTLPRTAGPFGLVLLGVVALVPVVVVLLAEDAPRAEFFVTWIIAGIVSVSWRTFSATSQRANLYAVVVLVMCLAGTYLLIADRDMREFVGSAILSGVSAGIIASVVAKHAMQG